MRINKNFSLKALLLSLSVASLLAGCQEDKPEPGDARTPIPVSSSNPAPGSDLPGATTPEPGAERATTVRVATVVQEDISLDQKYKAEVLPAYEVEIRSRVEGYLEEFYFREGSRVEAGQILFSVDPRPLEADREVARARVEDARAKLRLAQERVNLKKAKANLAASVANLENEQREVDRYRPLMESSTIPKQLYDKTVSARDIAKAQLDAAKAEVENTEIRERASIEGAKADLQAATANLSGAQVDMDYTTITSPATGIIGKLNVYPGSLVSPSNAVLATISTTDPIYVEFAISEGEYLALNRSDKTQQEKADRNYELILADGEPYKYSGKFELLDRTIDQQTGTLKVRLEYKNPTGTLRPGQYVNVRLNKEDLSDALLVPQRAVLELQSSKFVWIVGDNSTVEQREIEVGPRHNDSFVIASGLRAGEKVVVDGMARLKPGMKVSAEAVE